MNIDYLRKILEKIDKSKLTNEDLFKYESAKELLKNDDLFFKIDVETALGLLEFLGIPEDKMKDTYLKLISYQNYQASKDNTYTLYER